MRLRARPHVRAGSRVLLQGSVVEGGGLPTKGRLRSSVQLHQRASVRYVACLIHVDDRKATGNPGRITCCGVQGESQQQFPDEGTRHAPWLGEFLNELLAFPNSRHDDQVDSVTQFLGWQRGRQRRHRRISTVGSHPGTHGGLTPTRLKPAVSDDDERVEAGGPGEGVRLRRVGLVAHPPPARLIFTFGLWTSTGQRSVNGGDPGGNHR